MLRSGRKTMRLWGNDYNKMEFAGAFGDLGTLIPFVVGYITLNKMDPLGILVAFGLFKILVASLKLCMTHLPGLSGSFRLVQSTLSRTS